MNYLKYFVCALLCVPLMGLLTYRGVHATEANEIIEVIDCADRLVRLKKTARRIVDLTFAEGVRTLVALDAQDYLIGMSDMDHQVFKRSSILRQAYVILPQVAMQLNKLPNVGSHKEPNIEKILSLNPDVIFVLWSRKEYADTLQKQINIPVVCVGGYGSFNFELFNVVGKITGKEQRARELVSFTKNKFKKINTIIKNLTATEKKRIFYWVRPLIGTPMTNGRYEAFDFAGAVNVAAEGTAIPYGVYKVTKEQIIAWDPDYIFRQSGFISNPPGWHTIDTIKQDVIIKNTKAAKNNAVFPVRGHMRGWDIATEAVEVFYIAKILYPDKFIDLDVEKEGNEILEKFYRKAGLFTVMSKKIGLYQWE